MSPLAKSNLRGSGGPLRKPCTTELRAHPNPPSARTNAPFPHLQPQQPPFSIRTTRSVDVPYHPCGNALTGGPAVQSSSRTRALRRMKGQSLGSTRGATSTSGASFPAYKEEEPVPSFAALARSQSSKQSDREMVRPSFLGSHSRKPSDESQSAHSGHIPEVQSPSMAAQPSIAQSVNPVLITKV